MLHCVIYNMLSSDTERGSEGKGMWRGVEDIVCSTGFSAGHGWGDRQGCSQALDVARGGHVVRRLHIGTCTHICEGHGCGEGGGCED